MDYQTFECELTAYQNQPNKLVIKKEIIKA